MNLKNAYLHLKTINRHRRYVRSICFKLGLYKQGMLHDLSKYSWVEFRTGIKYFKGTISPNTAERLDTGVSEAWLHHKGRNKHHLEYWIDYDVNNPKSGFTGMPMPVNYVVEMFADRVAACKNYEGENYTDASAWNYYNRGTKDYMLHERTRALLELMMLMLKDKGEEYTYDYIRREILKNKK